MRAENNYFKINRSLLQSDLWLSEPFTRGQAWVDLFGLALHTDGYMRIRGIKITIKRGQLAYSKRTLSKRWGWSQEKTDRFLNELENDGKIDTQKNNLTTIISILKYDFWQGDKEKTEHRTSHRSRTEPVTLIYNKKDNKDKKDNNIINILRLSKDNLHDSEKSDRDKTIKKIKKPRNPCPIDDHDICKACIDSLAAMKNLEGGWINYAKQLSMLHRLLSMGYNFEVIMETAKILDADNYWWERWDVITIASQLEKRGKETYGTGNG